jgi:phospholipid-binding lipoprotein MlaA
MMQAHSLLELGRQIFVLLVIGLAAPILNLGVAHTQDVTVAGVHEQGVIIAQATADKPPTKTETAAAAESAGAAGEFVEWDPWEPFNERMFWFNREVLDRFVLKPVATGWDFILPNQVQKGIHNLFDNLAVVRRVVNNALQFRFDRAAKEAARFTINSTIGIVGIFDVAKEGFGIEQNDTDAGITLGFWGAGPGPYLILPFLPPLTVRDGVGYAVDVAMTPYIYFIPWYASLGGTATNMVNERSLNLEYFERVAESTVDLYGAVRNAYLQRRAAQIRQ